MKKWELNSKITFSKTTGKSFDSDKKNRYIMDEIGHMAETPTGLSKWQLELRKKKLGI